MSLSEQEAQTIAEWLTTDFDDVTVVNSVDFWMLSRLNKYQEVTKHLTPEEENISWRKCEQPPGDKREHFTMSVNKAKSLINGFRHPAGAAIRETFIDQLMNQVLSGRLVKRQPATATSRAPIPVPEKETEHNEDLEVEEGVHVPGCPPQNIKQTHPLALLSSVFRDCDNSQHGRLLGLFESGKLGLILPQILTPPVIAAIESSADSSALVPVSSIVVPTLDQRVVESQARPRSSSPSTDTDAPKRRKKRSVKAATSLDLMMKQFINYLVSLEIYFIKDWSKLDELNHRHKEKEVVTSDCACGGWYVEYTEILTHFTKFKTVIHPEYSHITDNKFKSQLPTTGFLVGKRWDHRNFDVYAKPVLSGNALLVWGIIVRPRDVFEAPNTLIKC